MGIEPHIVKHNHMKGVYCDCEMCKDKRALILKLYGEHNSMLSIQKQANTTYKYIKTLLKSEGIKYEKFSSALPMNTQFFDCIDTEDKAYVLGFLLADGCISARHHKNCVKWGVKATDIDVLKKIRKAVGSEKSISVMSYYDKRFGKTYHNAEFAFTSSDAISALLELGITPRKSMHEDIDLERIPFEMQKHFWRGVFDGDGSIGFTATHGPFFVLYGSYAICEKFRQYVELINGQSIRPKVYPTSSIYRLTISKKSTQAKIVDDLYSGANIYLDRKYAKALEVLAYFSEMEKKGKRWQK